MTGVLSRVAVGILATTGVILLVAVGPFDIGREPREPEAARGRSEIAVMDLVSAVEAEGALVAVDERVIVAAAGGTVTELTAIGRAVPPSTVLYRIDGAPTVALIGDVPGWRTMGLGDIGPDVAQLERNLVALGYVTDDAMTVDDTFTSITAAVVMEWQVDVGLPPTGRVEMGSLVFVPAGASVTGVSAAVGQTLNGGGAEPVLTVATDERMLEFTVGSADLSTLAPGTAVSARLPDRTTVDAVVNGLRPDGEGAWIAVAVPSSGSIDRTALAGGAVPVTVNWTDVVAEAAPVVRANALTRLDSGAYVVEVVEGDEPDFVEVEVGARAGANIEIITELDPGTEVITP